jgi:hypothetical protein
VEVVATLRPPGSGNGGPPLVVDADGNSTFNATVLGSSLAALPTETLSAAEQSSLVYMREEEKLAGDVYARLGATWGMRVFTNISASEATHTEAVRQLLQRYQVADPAANLGAGLFTNATPARPVHTGGGHGQHLVGQCPEGGRNH